ncbi:hypothetical protein P4631_13370 [Halalkalibacterium halodurans]|uniref:hypothetical protein n=1 Tax=Halalkalibacterium halodurans TaxID=86665 RepID=UPI0002DA079A|nr:hypothetical protein [Halalkalibacterium halodurans]MED4173421.1 hypothetical protein [Halalkalibacterium halodurans]
MDKSQILDELRLQIGCVPDSASTLTDFYVGIVQVLTDPLDDLCAAIFLTSANAFHKIVSEGGVPFTDQVRFGESLLSVVAIRGKLQCFFTSQDQTIISPFYNGHHLIGQLVIVVQASRYKVTEEDLIFVREVSRFIENQHIKYETMF